MNFFNAVIAAACAVAVSGQTCNCPADLCTREDDAWGRASWFNILTLGDLIMSKGSSDIEGPVAVGGVLKIGGAGVTQGIGHMIYCRPNEFGGFCPAPHNWQSTAFDRRACGLNNIDDVTGLLVNGGIENWNSGTVHMGNVVVSKDISEANPDLQSHVGGNGCRATVSDTNLFFEGVKEDLEKVQRDYLSLSATYTGNTVPNNFGFLVLSPNEKQTQEVIDLTADNLLRATRGWNFNRKPNLAAGNIIIRVRGTDITVPPASANNDNLVKMGPRITWFFPDATTVKLNTNNNPHIGHIFAPKATVTRLGTAGSQMINGRIVAKQVEVSNQVNWLDDRRTICVPGKAVCVEWKYTYDR